jgi:hypothetical protein
MTEGDRIAPEEIHRPCYQLRAESAKTYPEIDNGLVHARES